MIYGTPKTPVEDNSQEGEMSADDLMRLIRENYEDLEDGGASQEDFERYLDEQEKKDRKVH